MAIRSRVITMSPLILNQKDDLEVDLALWELVNRSDGEFSYDSFSVDSLSDDDVISLDDASFVSPSAIFPPPQMLPVADSGDLAADLDLDAHVDGDGGDDVRDEVDENDLRWPQRQMVFLGGDYATGDACYSVGITYGDYATGDACYDDGDEDRSGEDSEYDDSYDLDEELVPRSVSKKLGRQYSQLKPPYSQLKPGCVGGKHGLGMKFKY